MHLTSETFSHISERIGEASELVKEISQASSEQAHGIEQINQAVVNISQVTQQNALNAKEMERLVNKFKISEKNEEDTTYNHSIKYY